MHRKPVPKPEVAPTTSSEVICQHPNAAHLAGVSAMTTGPRQRIHPASSAAAWPPDFPRGDACVSPCLRFGAVETCGKPARPGLGASAPQRQSVKALVEHPAVVVGRQLVKGIRWNEH
jgi:hypothetical protein